MVYRTYDPELGRTVALNELTAGSFASQRASARFEAGRPYFPMEAMRGPSLQDVLRTRRPVALDSRRHASLARA